MHPNKPLVSAVIPVYNSETTISSCLASVVEQSYPHIEIIIVDDGSTDSSKELIAQFIEANNGANITYIYQENNGVSSARNVGMKSAKGDYIALLDSDDIWDKNKISIQVEAFLEHNDIDLLGTNRNDEKFSKVLGVKFQKLTKISAKLLLCKNFLITSTVMFKREILNETGFFNEKMSHAEDLEFLIRIATKYNCYLYNESLVLMGSGKPTFGHSGLSRNILKMEKGELKSIGLAYKLKALNFFEYILISLFSILKFCRRLIIQFLRKYKGSSSKLVSNP